MKLALQFEDGTGTTQDFNLPISIGKSKEMDVILKSWRVAREHAFIFAKEGYVFIEDKGSLLGTLLNGNRVHIGGPLHVGDEIIIGPCLITVKNTEYGSLGLSDKIAYIGQEGKQMESTPVDYAVSQKENTYVGQGKDGHQPIMYMPQINEVGKGNGQNTPNSSEMRPLLALEIYHRQRLHAALVEALDLRRRNISNMSDDILQAEAKEILVKIIESDQEIDARFNRNELIQAVLHEAIGLGPLEPLLEQADITEIMVNRFDEIYIEKAGRLEKTNTVFSSEKAVLGVIDRIVSPIGRRIDESSPMVDARLLDGSRVNAVIPPVALKGASITIRKFTQHRPQMPELIKLGSLDRAMADFLGLCVTYRMNMIISGGTGSGKTTLLNILSNAIAEHERIVTIEDAAELRLNHAHLVSLEARPANLEGKGVVTIRDLVRNALRMRPDRIVVGECRGAEAFDMLGAMNTGHEGSLTTLHANSPRDALSRLETMIMMADMDLPLVAIREHIANSIDFIVQQNRLSNGRRVISSIVEVGGMESGIIKTQEIFRYEKANNGTFVGCGIMPEKFEKKRKEGEHVATDLFNQYTPVVQHGTQLTGG